MSLNYHAESEELLGGSLSVSMAAVRELDSIERQWGFTFPAALREWYSLNDACAILDEHSNGDRPVLPEDMLAPREDTGGGGPHDLLTRGLVPIRYENQGVAVWAVRLDGSDDPPVLVDFDTQFKEWRPCASSFSKYVYSCVWDYKLVMQHEAFACTDNIPFDDSQLKFLRLRFLEGPTTFGWPRDRTYRFRNEDQAFVIWADDVADWFLGAETEQGLKSLIRTIGHLESLIDYLYSPTEVGTLVIEHLQAERSS